MKGEWFPQQLNKSRLKNIFVGIALFLLALSANTAAQSNQLYVTINEIDSQSFPQVTALVTVADQDGLPISNLTAENFLVSEDGVPVDFNRITVEPVTLKNRYLVLAIDVSTYSDVLTEIQAAARTFVAGLKPEDRVSLVALYDKAEVVTPFTNNVHVLQSAIDSLALQGDFTTLHGSVEQGAAMVEQFPAGHRALIILPDSKNNSAPGSAENAIRKVQQVGVPLYLVGVKTNKISLQDMEEYATQTAGLVTVAEPDKVGAILQEIGARLPQGYRITVQSQVPADDQNHRLVVTAKYRGLEEWDKSGFVAKSSPVVVSVPYLSNGQTVGGLVYVEVKVASSASPVSVEYLLDGQPLTTLTSPPYSFNWDTSKVSPGVHTLTVRATDAATNQGEMGIILNIVPAVQVMVSSNKTEAAVYEKIFIQAQVEAVQPLARVDLLLNGTVVESSTTPPYSFTFDSSAITPKKHLFTVQATDQLRQTGKDSLVIEFFPAWKERLRRWLGIEERAKFDFYLLFAKQTVIIAAAILLILLLLLLALLLLNIFRKMQIAKTRQKFELAVMNLGNSRSHYQLWAEDTAKALQFSFWHKGVELRNQTITEIVAEPAAPQPLTRAPAPQKAQSNPVNKPAKPDKEKKKKSSESVGVGDRASGAMQKTNKMMRFVSPIGNILNAVARILPRPLGRPLQAVASTLTGQRARIKQTMRVPQQVARTTSTVKQQSKQLVPKRMEKKAKSDTEKNVSSKQVTETMEQTASAPVPASAPAAAVVSAPAASLKSTDETSPHVPIRQRANGQHKTITKSVRLKHAQTPFISPGKVLMVDMLITPQNPYKQAVHNFTVYSVALEQPDTAPVIQKSRSKMPGIPWLLRYLPSTFVLLAVTLIITAIVFLAIWLLNANLLEYYFQITCFIRNLIPGFTTC